MVWPLACLAELPGHQREVCVDQQNAGPGCRCCLGHRLLVPPFQLFGQQHRRIRIGAARDGFPLGSGLTDVGFFLAFKIEKLNFHPFTS